MRVEALLVTSSVNDRSDRQLHKGGNWVDCGQSLLPEGRERELGPLDHWFDSCGPRQFEPAPFHTVIIIRHN